MRGYVLSRPAERDLESIIAHLAEHAGARVARKVLREFRSAIRFLTKWPDAGHLREDLTEQPLRFWPVYSYLVIYDPTSRPLQIVRIVHGARDVETLLR